ncbi:MAG: DUF2107 family protein [Methanoculleus sp.]
MIAAGFPRPRTHLSRLICLEIPGLGLLLIMLAYDEMLALVTFIGVTAISTFVLYGSSNGGGWNETEPVGHHPDIGGDLPAREPHHALRLLLRGYRGAGPCHPTVHPLP